jgi:hypothetical protein
MLLRKPVTRQSYHSAWMIDDVCITSALHDMQTNAELSVDEWVGVSRSELLAAGFLDLPFFVFFEGLTLFDGEQLRWSNW